ncbi:MAG: hypothetical protein U0324_31510 [Polyangiales bacterium]
MGTPNNATEELDKLDQAALKELLAALSNAARRVAARKRWAGSNVLGTSSGLEEFVFGVLEKVLSGARPWSRTDGHTLRQHLFMCIQSEVDNLAARKDNAARDECEGDPEPASAFPSPEQALATKQWALHAQSVLGDVAGEDALLQKIADLWFEGYVMPADIAERLELPVEQISVALRKFDRRLQASEARSRIGSAA